MAALGLVAGRLAGQELDVRRMRGDGEKRQKGETGKERVGGKKVRMGRRKQLACRRGDMMNGRKEAE